MKKPSAVATLLLVVSLCACPVACAQGMPMGFDAFAEFGPSCQSGAVHSGANGQERCEAGRFFTGGRLRLTRHDAFEASYSYSPHVFSYSPYIFAGGYSLSYQNNDIHSHSLNYVRYLAIHPRVQPLVTGGIGSERFQGRIVYPSITSLAFPYSSSQFAWN